MAVKPKQNEPCPAAPGPGGEEAAAREARLAKALRDNLKRRKAAGRGPGEDRSDP